MAHFSVSGDSIASHCIFVGIGFETYTCNNYYLAAFVLPGPAIYLLLWQDVVFRITVLCLLILSLAL